MTLFPSEPPPKTVANHRNCGSLFDAIDTGFCIVEMKFDVDGSPSDFVYLEASPVFEAQMCLERVVGRRMRELAPETEQFWYETYGNVATTGVAQHFQHEGVALGRVFDVQAIKTGRPEERQVVVLFTC